MGEFDVKELEPTMLDIGALLAAEDGALPEVSCDEDPSSGAVKFRFEWPTVLSFFLPQWKREEMDELGLDGQKAVLYDQFEQGGPSLAGFLREWADHIDRNVIAVKKARRER